MPRLILQAIGSAHSCHSMQRINKPVLDFFNLYELKSFLAAADRYTWAGRRDCLLFSLLYNTGARISEALQLTPADIQHRVARLHGKGRKERDVPLWSQTLREIQKWCHENKIGSTQPIFSNRDGKPLSRRSAARRFALTLRKARKKCPALSRPNLSPHTLGTPRPCTCSNPAFLWKLSPYGLAMSRSSPPMATSRPIYQ
jgi:integrase